MALLLGGFGLQMIPADRNSWSGRWSSGVAECLAAIMPTAWAYDLSMIVIGAATQLFAVSATVYIQQATPAAQRRHALSAYNAGFMGLVPAGAFVVAALVAAGAVSVLAARLWPGRPGVVVADASTADRR
jgi:hypothetical protein